MEKTRQMSASMVQSGDSFELREGSSPGSLPAILSYLKPTSDRPCNYTYEPPPGVPWESGEYEAREVAIADGRQARIPALLDREGFQLLNAPTSVRNFSDENAIRATYYREASELALAVTGAKKALVFDHLVRKQSGAGTPLAFSKKGREGISAANGRIHNDYTEQSGSRRLSLVLRDTSDILEVERYSIINIWRPINRPVLQTPLALCAAGSVSPQDLVASDVLYTDRTGEIYLLTYNFNHRWTYFPEMAPHEAIVFKQFDSQCSDTSKFTPHAAFNLPNAPADAPSRESIEIRCLVIY